VADEVEIHASLPNARIEQVADGIAGAVEAGDAPVRQALYRAGIPEMALYPPVSRNRKVLCA
jgi:hypothetical protein